MNEAAARQRCRRCGAPVSDSDDPICDKCQYDDWHEEYPDLESQEGDE
jgi:ribosomal protein L37E